MEYVERDHEAIIAHCEAVEQPEQVVIQYLPPQPTPRWARQYTARPVGTRLGNGNYMRLGTGGNE